MVHFRSPATGAAQATAVPEDDSTETFLLLETERAREALLAQAQKDLPEGECLVEVKDLHARRRYFTTRPSHRDARLVARTAPRILRGSLLSIVSYYAVPSDKLDGVETHHENGSFSHSYEVRLKPVVRGHHPEDAPLVPA